MTGIVLPSPASATGSTTLFWIADTGLDNNRVYSSDVTDPLVPNLISGSTTTGGALATDGSHLFFAKSGSGPDLLQVDLDGTNALVLDTLSVSPTAMTYDGGYLYWTQWNDGVFRLNVADPSAGPVQLVTAGADGAPGTGGYFGLVVTATAIYFSVYDGNPVRTSNALYRATLSDAGAVVSIVKGDPAGYNAFGPVNLATDGTSLYMSGGGAIGRRGVLKVDLASWSSAVTTWSLLDTSALTASTYAMGLAGGSVYFTDYYNNVYSMTTTGSGLTSLYQGDPVNSSAYALVAVEPSYAVTYSANGAASGAVPVDPSSPYSGGTTVTVLGNTGVLTRSGYVFAGWNTAADGAGTTYAPGATFIVAADTVLYARWTASGGGGGGSSSGASTPEPSPTATPTPTQPAILPSLGAEPVPGGLVPGADRVTVGGAVAPALVGPNTQSNGLEASGPGWRLSLAASTATGQSAPLGPNGVLRFVRGQRLVTEGAGYKPNSPVQLYLFSNATFLGELTTDASGSFSGSVDLPAGVAVGGHVAQVNGYTTGDEVRSVSLGIEVVEPATVATSVGSRVYFPYRSAKLTPKAKSTLRSLASQVPANATASSVVVGIVQAQSPRRGDRALARTRAANVARYLRAAGLPGTVSIRTQSVKVNNVAEARRVVVTVRYTR